MTSEGKPCEVCPDSKRDICWKSTSMGCPTWEAWITMVNRIKRVEALPQKWRSTEKAHDGVRCHAWKVCADELEDELSGIQGKALDGEPYPTIEELNNRPITDLVEKDSNVYEKSFVETYPTRTADYSPDKCCNVSHPLCFGTCTMQDACQQCNWNTPCADKTKVKGESCTKGEDTK